MIKKWRILSAIFLKKSGWHKPSALTVLTIKLESEYNFGPQGLCVFIAITLFEVIVFNASNNVFSQSYVSADFITFIAVAAVNSIIVIIIYPVSIYRIISIAAECSRVEVSSKRTIAVVSIYAPRTRLRCFCSALR